MDDHARSAKVIEVSLLEFAKKCAETGSEMVMTRKPLCVVERAIQEGTPKLKRLQAMTLLYGMLVHLSKLKLHPEVIAMLVCDSVQMWVGEDHEVTILIEPDEDKDGDEA